MAYFGVIFYLLRWLLYKRYILEYATLGLKGDGWQRATMEKKDAHK